MRKTSIYDYYRFGYNYGLIRRTSSALTPHGSDQSAAHRIRDLLEQLELLALPVSSKACTGLGPLLAELEAMDATAEIGEDRARKIREAFTRIDTTLTAEVQLRHAYVLVTRRLPLENLLDNPAGLFPIGVFSQLPPIAQSDFTEAGKCIAYGVGTAAAFHTMRGLEAVLRAYYRAVVRRKRIKVLMWGPMVEHLRRRSDAPPKTLLDNLDNVRVNFRNPTQHPDATYDLDGAQDLLALAVELVGRLLRDATSRGASLDVA
jgi:hypothetical protein